MGKRTLYLFIILTVFLLQSCFDSPTNQPEKDPELIQLWSYDHGTVGDAPPVVSGANVFASGGLYLFALNEETGDLIWQVQVDDDNELHGQILLLKDNQIVANHFGKIRGWSKDDGNLEWEHEHILELEARLIGNHTVTPRGYVFNSNNSKVFELNTSGDIILEKALDKNYLVNGVSYNDGNLFVGQKQTIHGALTLGRITALDAQTGDSLWAYDTENGGFSWAAPIIENGVVYAGAIGNSPVQEFVALDAETGEVIWRQTDKVWTFSFTLGPDHIYVNTGGTLAALNKTDGSIIWRYEWSSGTSIQPVYLEGYVYHSDHGRIFVLDAETGQMVHEEPVPPGGSYFWHLAVSSDKLFAQTSRQLIAYQPWHLREE